MNKTLNKKGLLPGDHRPLKVAGSIFSWMAHAVYLASTCRALGASRTRSSTRSNNRLKQTGALFVYDRRIAGGCEKMCKINGVNQ